MTCNEIETMIRNLLKKWNVTDQDFTHEHYAPLILDEIWEGLSLPFSTDEWQHYARTFDFKSDEWKNFNPEFKRCHSKDIIRYLWRNSKKIGKVIDK